MIYGIAVDIKTLKSFICVAENQSFSIAARELNTVQPAISRHIALLEEELGVPLFTRSSREVTITAAGKQLLHDARHILQLTVQAKDQVQRAHNGKIGSLNIAYLSSACFTFMAKLVRIYSKQYPHVRVSLFEMTATQQIDAFNNNSIDIGFSRPLPLSISQSFTQHTIYTDKLMAIVSKRHPRANDRDIKLSDLKNDDFTLFNRDEAVGLFDNIIALCKHAEFSPKIINQPKHMQTLLTQVASGLGVSIAPYCIRKHYSDDCCFLTLTDVDKKIPIQLHFQQTNTSNTVAAFVNIVLAEIPQIQRNMAD